MAFLSVFVIASWWYVRNVRLVGTVIWIDGAPQQKMGWLEVLGTIPKVNWSTMIDSLMKSHIWFGNWSFLSVRNWMYRVFEYGAAIAAGGVAILVVRHLVSPSARDGVIKAKALFLCATIYGMFLISIAYHALMNFINDGISASSGWYLYAVVFPQSVLVLAGLLAFRWGRQMLAIVVGFFFALEMYATHFVLIPYYSGLVSHAPDGGLRSFHVSQLREITLTELLSRLAANRPPFINSLSLITLWCVFLIAAAALVYLATKWMTVRLR
jgi:hypothetical protein